MCSNVSQILRDLQPHRLYSLRLTTADYDELTRGEGYSAHVHQVALADLDGDGVAEILEIRSDDATSARLRVYAH